MDFRFKHDGFEGPLGLLLELIENEKMDISNISLAKVTDEYVKHVKSLEKTDPEQLAEFLVVAAQLMLIKSRTLLPNLKLEPEEQFSVDELEKRLAEYKRMRDLAKELKQLESKNFLIFTREQYWGVDPVFYPPKKIGVNKLQEMFWAFLSALPKIEKLAEEKIKKIISLEEKINHIRSYLQETVEKAFSEVIKNSKEKIEVIVSFLAILELAKQKFLDLKQEKLFEDIMIKKL